MSADVSIVETMGNFEINCAIESGTSDLASLLPENAQPILILFAEEPSVFRDGLGDLLGAQPECKIVSEAANLTAVLELAVKCKRDIILFKPEGSGMALHVLRSLRQSGPAFQVILLTSPEDTDLLRQAVPHWVSGIVAKKNPTELLLKSIRKVSAGELWLDRTTAAVRHLTGSPIRLTRDIPAADKPVSLSRREREIVAHVAQGFRNREIADKLYISEQTVKNHMHNIFEKVGVQDRLELALYAIYHRLYETLQQS